MPHSDGPGLNFSLTVFHLTLFSIVTSDEEFHLGEWARFPSKTKREGEAESLMFKILIRVILEASAPSLEAISQILFPANL